MKPNRFLKLLREKKYTAGSWVSLCSPLGAEVMGMAGFDWLLLDMEHGSGDYQTLLTQLQGIAAGGESTPIVRVEWNDPSVIKRVLDLGAEGVMVPGIRSAEEARLAVESTKYPPHGFRGIAGVRAGRFGKDKDYLHQSHQHVAVFIQIENRSAIANIAEILAVPGIDVVFIGPNDLAADMGHTGELNHPDVQAAIAKVDEAAHARGIALGTVSTSWDEAKTLVDKGYRAVSLMGDIPLLMQGAQGLIGSFRGHPNVGGA